MTAVLDHVRHERLLSDLDHICQIANIPKALIETSAVGVVGPLELEWVKRFRLYQAQGKGLLLTGVHDPSVEMKMMSMTAAFLRNFIDARVLSINKVIECIEDNVPIDCTVLLVPNFHVAHAQGRNFQAWKIQAVYDLLLSRLSQGNMNCLYVRNMDDMAQEYGEVFKEHIHQRYILSKGK